MAEQVYLAIDLGAESGRVMAGHFDGQRVRLEEIHRFANGPVAFAGTRRWDVLSLWNEIQNGLRIAGSRYRDQLVSVGVDTWGVDYVLLSSQLELLGFPYHYRDSRTDGLVDHACTRVSRREIFAATGLQFMPINSLYQVLAMQLKDPDLLEMAGTFLMMPDFFHWLLCGSRVAEFTNATTTQFFDPVQREWARDLLRQFDVPTGMLPEVVSPGTKLGQLRRDVAAVTGLPRLDVVAPATHDTGSAVAAVPTQRTGNANWAYISSGTWSLIGVEVQQAILSDEALLQNITNEGGVDGTYRLLKNVMGLWLVQECRRIFELAGHDFDYAQLTYLASQAAPFRSLISPDDAAFFKPENMVQEIQDFCRKQSQPVPESEGQLIRCALESLAFRYREVLQGIQKLTGEKVEVIHIVGGGCQNELLNQFTANACGVPVVAGPVEATALGNVLIQARAGGAVGTLEDVRNIVRNSYPLHTFEPQATDDWSSAYERYRQLAAAAKQ